MKDSAQEARAQVRPLRASVLIGLGGTGKRILTEVRKRIIETYDSLDRLPIVGFLTIDTDQEKLILGEVDDLLQQKIAFSPSEEIHATVTGTHKLKSEIRSYPHIHEWIDPRILELGDVQFGAKGIRALGRLAFFLNYPRIRKAFNDLVNRVSDLGNIKYMAKTHGVQVEKGVNVFTVSSLCGGTGSGMFLDLAFMVKQELVGQEHTRLAYLVMPGIFGTDLTHATGYAALRELNHYSMFHDFEVRWEGDPKVTVLQPPPFDYCYLINNRNSKVTFSRPNDLFEMAGHDIFLEFAHEFGQYKASLKDNTGAQAASTDKLGAPLNYMSMGLASICFPRDRVISACAHRLAGAAVDWWLSVSPDTDKVRE
ncbi:MAG: tubulin-like doman-containing protein [Armatimonadetes bacterium]|nr:tubulin-like doman-containing protein [Armatimonadota bacterium]